MTRIAVIQLAGPRRSPADVRARTIERLEQAAARGAELAVLSGPTVASPSRGTHAAGAEPTTWLLDTPTQTECGSRAPTGRGLMGAFRRLGAARSSHRLGWPRPARPVPSRTRCSSPTQT
jgi:hypothetical protein